MADFGPFVVHPARALHDRRISHLAYRVLGALVSRADRDGWVRAVTHADLGDDVGVARSEMTRCLNQLAAAGYVLVHARRDPVTGHRLTSEYQLVFDLPELHPAHDRRPQDWAEPVENPMSDARSDEPTWHTLTHHVGSTDMAATRENGPMSDSPTTGGSYITKNPPPPSLRDQATKIAAAAIASLSPTPLIEAGALGRILEPLVAAGWSEAEIVAAAGEVRYLESRKGWEFVLRQRRQDSPQSPSKNRPAPMGCADCTSGWIEAEGGVVPCPTCRP